MSPSPSTMPTSPSSQTTPLRNSIERRLLYRINHLRTEQQRLVEMEMCRRKIVHWVNHHCWTYDPREPTATLPFDCFPKQEALFSWLAERERKPENGLIEKSRDVGVTWICVFHAVHGWLFRKGYAVGFGSRKLDLVDKKGDPDCIFEKVRFLLDNLSKWMLPKQYGTGYCNIRNLDNGASITGEGGDNIGRGGRKAIFFVDEAAYLEHPTLIERSLAQTTNVRIDVSTPNGPGTPFSQKRFSGTIPVFSLHWRDDPRKTEEWYAEFCRTHDPVTVAQELEIDHSASIEGILIPGEWVRAAVNLKLPRSEQIVAGLDIAEMGRDLTVFQPRAGPVIDWPVSWAKVLTHETACRARKCMADSNASTLYYDADGLGTAVRASWMASEKRLPFQTFPVNAGSSPSELRWPDGRTSGEIFGNLRAEVGWLVRRRFEKTFEYVTQGVEYPLDELISIPPHAELIAQLSLPLYRHRENGKIYLESKEDMRDRGVKSPDFFDSLCLSFYPRPRVKLNVGT
jgi:phage terminase large subunit